MRKLNDGSIKYTEREIAQFERAASVLAKLGKAGAKIYLDEDCLNLLSGDSHDGKNRSHPERVVKTVWIPGSGGGMW